MKHPTSLTHPYSSDQSFVPHTSRVRECHHAIIKCLIADRVESTQCDLRQDLRPIQNHFPTSNPWARPCGERGKRWATKSFLDLPFSPHSQEPNDLMRSPLCHWWTQICMEKSRHTLSTEPPFSFWNYLVLGDEKPWRGWAQGDSGFIASRHSLSVSSYIWLVEYRGGPDLLRI